MSEKNGLGLPPSPGVTVPGTPVPSYAQEIPPASPAPRHEFDRSVISAYILAIPPLGLVGAHHYYLSRKGFGLVYTLTLGLLGVGWLFDLLRMPCLVKQCKEQAAGNGKGRKNASDAYVLWFPLGLFGFHHFYLRRWGWGFAYFFTIGLLGIGWLLDGFRMCQLVRQYNKDVERKARNEPKPLQEDKSVCDAYLMCIPPFGLLGVQHYYLGRIGFGLFYSFTLGGFGIGWIVDLFRMPCLVKSTNMKRQGEGINGLKRLDDAYILAFPLGLIGFHNYYLGRTCWGVLYTCTLGVLGIGWIIDMIRMPCLVKDANRSILEQQQCIQSDTPSVVNVSEHTHIVVPSNATVYVTTAGAGNPGFTLYPNELRPANLQQDAHPPSYDEVLQHPPQRPPPPQPPPLQSAWIHVNMERQNTTNEKRDSPI